MSTTYEILYGGRAIKCLRCSKVSYYIEDVKHRYCSGCRMFHDISSENPVGVDDVVTLDVNAEQISPVQVKILSLNEDGGAKVKYLSSGRELDLPLEIFQTNGYVLKRKTN